MPRRRPALRLSCDVVGATAKECARSGEKVVPDGSFSYKCTVQWTLSRLWKSADRFGPGPATAAEPLVPGPDLPGTGRGRGLGRARAV